jgi:hypothetical protein
VELKAAGVEAEAGAGQALALSQRMKAAFQSSCGTLDQLVDTAAALEEELLHASCVSRLDDFKNGLEYPTSASTSNGRPVKTAQTEKPWHV